MAKPNSGRLVRELRSYETGRCYRHGGPARVMLLVFDPASGADSGLKCGQISRYCPWAAEIGSAAGSYATLAR